MVFKKLLPLIRADPMFNEIAMDLKVQRCLMINATNEFFKNDAHLVCSNVAYA